LSDGYVHGTTEWGGAGRGTLYRVRSDGANFRTLHAFDGWGDAWPADGMRFEADGTMSSLGALGSAPLPIAGALYYVGPDNRSLCRSDAYGHEPVVLFRSDDQYLFGPLVHLGPFLFGIGAPRPAGHGFLFRIDLDGGRFTLLHAFGER
jgi:uncharacterized repeat protein (TIGR03803 family)